MSHKKIVIAFLSACLGSINCTLPLLAQVIPDRTLGDENSTVQSDAVVKDVSADLIEGGAIRDSNLFHSFTELNVSAGDSLYFANPEGITNILTRITGNNLSEIFGTLGVDGAANLFLLNPNGIVFGENAALDVNGSFLATTAESYIFENDFGYSAANPDTVPLLTVNLPVGVQFGSNPAAIEVRGVENSFTFDEQFSVITDNRPVGLEVDSDSTLTLLGGEINLQAGSLTTSGGRVELGAIGELETVNFNNTGEGLSLDYAQVNNFQDINFSQSSSIDVSGSGAGDIQLTGQNISLLDGSVIIANTTGADNGGEVSFFASDRITIRGQNSMPAIIASKTLREATGNAANLIFESDFLLLGDEAIINLETFGQGDSGDLTINASQVELSQETFNLPFPSGILSRAALGATGDTGNITINSDRIVIKDGTQIQTGVFGNGNVGNLTLNAAEIEISGFFPSSGITSSTAGNGNGGNITLSGNRLILRDGGFIFSGTAGAGNGGNLIANVSEIEIIGFNPESRTVSGLFSSTNLSSTGDAGNLTLNGDLLLIDGGQVFSGSFGTGNGGNLVANISEIEIKDTDLDVLNEAGISSGTAGEGNAGDLTINGNLLTIREGGNISTLTQGQGNAGNLNIMAENILVTGSPLDGTNPNGITAGSNTSSSAGNLNITTDQLNVTNNVEIAVRNTAFGDAGNIKIIANEVNLDNEASLSAAVNQGEGGNISLTTSNISLNRNSQITTQALNDATGGNIRISNEQNILLRGNSQINAQASEGNGGNIAIDTQGFFLSTDSFVSASSEFGFSGIVEINTIETDPTEDSFDIPMQTVKTELAQTCKSSDSDAQSEFTVSGRGSLPESPKNFLETDSGLEDWRTDTAVENDSRESKDKEQSDNDHANSAKQTRIIEAQVWKINERGNVALVMNHGSLRSLDIVPKMCEH